MRGHRIVGGGVRRKKAVNLSRMTHAERAAYRAKSQKTHETYVRRTYGLDAGEYAALLAEQGGVCAICSKKPKTRRLAVDHDHVDGRVRGLLCYVCNTSIGTFEFNASTALNAARYLARIAMDMTDRGQDHIDTKPPKAPIEIPVGDLPF